MSSIHEDEAAQFHKRQFSKDESLNDSVFKKSTKGASLTGAIHRKLPELITPTRRTILNDFDKETIGKTEASLLNKLYPYSTRNIIDSELDKESKKSEFSVADIKQNEPIALAICELLETIFHISISAYETKKLRKVIGLTDYDYGLVWNAFFFDGKGFAFDKLIRVRKK